MEQNNIFENAYFGKVYKTRDGSKVIFICKRTDNSRYDLNRPYACIVDGFGEIFNYYPNGKLYLSDNFETENDIVSEWQEELNDDELAKLINETIKEKDKISKQCEGLGQCYGYSYVDILKDVLHKLLKNK